MPNSTSVARFSFQTGLPKRGFPNGASMRFDRDADIPGRPRMIPESYLAAPVVGLLVIAAVPWFSTGLL
jgi:hypothetical protein